MNEHFILAEDIKILVAEDDAEDFFLLKQRADQLGIKAKNVINVTSLLEAHEKLTSAEYDAILLDLNIEDSKGIETIQSLHKSFPDIPKIVLSGCSDLKVSRLAVRYGAQDFIFKGEIRNIDLVQRIGYAIDRNNLLKKLKDHSSFKSKFLAQMSHEIRTPMNGVIGLTDALRHSKNLSLDEIEMVETIANCGRHLIDLISDILDISKIEAGMMEFDVKEFNIRNLIDDVVSIFSEQAAEKNITIFTSIHPNIPAILKGDKGRISQVLANLVGNAVKYTDDGEVSICLRMKDRNRSNARFCFEIKDTGTGVPVEFQDRLFSEYSQMSSQNENCSIRGTGLGLAICKGIIDGFNGQIGVRSNNPQGSNFWFEVNLEILETKYKDRSNFNGKIALIISESNKKSSILKAQLSLRHLDSVQIHPSDIQNPSVLHSLIQNSSHIDIVLFDVCSFSKFYISGVIDRLRGAFTKDSLPVLLLEERSNENLEFDIPYVDKLVGCFSQSKLYTKIAILFDELDNDSHTSEIDKPNAATLKMKVLVVDDNEVNQKVAVKMLEVIGCTSKVAVNGEEAVEIVQKEQFDAILMDCRMPVLDGFEATKTIRNLESPIKDIPIIALTANAYAEDKEQAKLSGMNGFITKPLLIGNLVHELSSFNQRQSNTPKELDGMDSKNEKSNAEILDFETLETLKSLEEPGDKDSFLDELIEMFMAQAPETIQDLKNAFKEGDARGIEHYSHKLKGFSRNLGAIRLTQICDHIESNAKELSKLPDMSLLETIQKEFVEAKKTLSNDWYRKVG